MDSPNITKRMIVTMREAMRLLHETRPDRARMATVAIHEAVQTLARSLGDADEPALSDVDQNTKTPPRLTPFNCTVADGLSGELLNKLRTPPGPRTVPPIRHKVPPTPKLDADTGAPGRFIDGSYENSFGARSYKLYIPTSFCGEPLPLLVMLHGCTQDSTDFALGTQMNTIAEKNACFVLYPSQAQYANSSKCWNWFKTSDQRRDSGEPSILAEMTREIVKTFNNNKSKVFVAGMSSGGAMAMILAATYPDLFVAAGIHSGLPYGAADDLPSALAAMREGATAWTPPTDRIPIIVFHGEQDKTVHPRNGAQIVAQYRPLTLGLRLEAATSEQHTVPGGRTYSRTVYRDPTGQIVAEHWRIQNAGHTWSGGSNRGSHTDPRGPDASSEMLRFFLAQQISREVNYCES